MSKEKKKMVILEDSVHNRLKHLATDENSTIQEETNKILKKELKIEGK